MTFTHLHVHGEHSIVDSRGTMQGYLEQASALGQDALALTDHGSIAGAVAFYQEARKVGIKPIIGCELYVDYFHDDEDEKARRYPKHLTVLATSEAGYRALIAVVTEAHRQFKQRPRIPLMELGPWMGEWIVLSGCPSSPISRLLLQKGDDWRDWKPRGNEAKRVAEWIRSHAAGFYIEVMRHESDEAEYRDKQALLYERTLQLAKRGFPVVATNDVHYHNREQEEIDRHFRESTTRAIKERVVKGKGMKELEFEGYELYLKDASEMNWARGEWLEATEEIARRCNVRIPEADNLQWYVPSVVADPVDELDRMCRDRLDDLPMAYTTRYEKEADVLRRKPIIAQSYLVAADLVTWCLANGIRAQGRGSMAGSLISWLLGITIEDPVRYQLKFERAVNPARPTIPDFDIDVSSRERHRVLAYLAEKYVESRQIISYVSYGPKGAARKAMSALGYDFAASTEIADKLPPDWETYATGTKVLPEEILPYVEASRGLYSTSSVHPAGVLLAGAERQLLREVPMTMVASSRLLVSQYDMYTLKRLGLFKLDVLGLKALDQLETMRTITGVEPPNGYYEDEAVLEAINQGYVADIFQLEGGAARKCINVIPIKTFEDVVVITTISRPGAMQFIDDYRTGNRQLMTRFPALREVLEMSKGVILYQEQVMEICHILAGFDDAEQDAVKEAMKYLSGYSFKGLKDRFLSGCQERGFDGDSVWAAIEKFAGYAFNRAHAVSYAGLSWRMMWYKVYHPAAFYAAVFDESSERTHLVIEAKHFGVTWEMPDVNVSRRETWVEGARSVRLGLGCIKGMGPKAIEALMEVRPVESEADLLEKVNRRACNKGKVEILRLCGLFAEEVEYVYLSEALEVPLEAFRKDVVEWSDHKDESTVGGIVAGVKTWRVSPGKKDAGRWMAAITLVNSRGSYRCIFFAQTWARVKKRAFKAAIFKGNWKGGEFMVSGGFVRAKGT